MRLMPAAMPAEIAERLADVHVIPPSAGSLEQAKEELVDRLVAGRNVHCINARDIFDGVLNTELGYHDVLDLLESLLTLGTARNEDDRMLKAYEINEKAVGFIERFVETRPDWIEELAAEMEREDE